MNLCEEYDHEQGSMDEQRAIMEDLEAENQMLKEKLALGGTSDEYQNELFAELNQLRNKCKAQEAELKAVKLSRDKLLAENAALRRQVYAQAREMGRLQA